MIYYECISTVLWIGLFAIWSSREWQNVTFKLIALGMGIWSLVAALSEAGWVVKGL